METIPSALQDHLGYWLRLVSNEVSGAFATKVAAHGVSVAEWVLLRELFGLSALMQSEIAARMGMTRGAISKLADKLVEKGLVRRRADASDARVQFLELTARGRKLVPVLAKVADANDAEFFGHLNRSERRALELALRRVVANRAITGSPVD